jgi:two-component system, response regulator PdtaR
MPASIVDLDDIKGTPKEGVTKLLLVEDEVIVAEDVKKRLESLGYAVIGIATRGQEAVEMAASMHPHLVLMDIGLRGGMDGIETVKRMREKVDVPVVFASAYSDDATLQRAKQAGPQGFVLKPFEERELHATIEMAIQKHSAEKLLRENESLFRMVFEILPDGLYVEDAMRQPKLVNQALYRIFKISPTVDLTKEDAQAAKTGSKYPFFDTTGLSRRVASAVEAGLPVVDEAFLTVDGRKILMSFMPFGSSMGPRFYLWQFHEVGPAEGKK